MPRHRLAACVLLSISAALLGAVAAPTAAGAADTISVSAGSPARQTPYQNVGLLWIKAQASTPITGLTAHILSSTGTDLLDLPLTDFSLTSGSDGTPANGTWTIKTPITDGPGPGQLPPGTYTIGVGATDSGGTQITNLDAGTLYFLIQPTVTVQATPTTINYDNPKVTFSGTIMGILPGNNAAQPLPNQQVQLENVNQGTSSKLARAGTDGSYKATVDPGASSFEAQIAAGPTIVLARSSPITITVSHADHTKITAKVRPADVRYRRKATVSGTVMYQSGGTWKLLPHAPVRVEGTGRTIRTTTNAKGDYSTPLPTTVSTPLTVIAEEDGDGGLLSSSYTNAQLTVAYPVKFRWFTPMLSSFGYITARGCLETTVSGQSGPGRRVVIQYSSRGRKGPWKYLGRAPLSSQSGIDAACDNFGESYFWRDIPVRVASAYYRADFSGNSDYEPAVSAAVHRAKDVTRITSFSVSPRSVPRKSAVSVSGRLWRYDGRWRPYAHRKVTIIFKYQGTWYYYKHEPRTSSSGRFSGRFKVYVSAPWEAQYNGDKSDFASATRRIHVTVVSNGAAAFAGPVLRIAGVLRLVPGYAPSLRP